MSIQPKPSRVSPDLQGLLDTVLASARAQGLDQKTLAERAGVRPETVTRAKSRGTVDWATARALARSVDLDVAVLALPRPRPTGRSALADPRLGLAWSNPDAPYRALIAKAIERADFLLILKACKEHGISEVASVLQDLREQGEVAARSLDFADRSLRNIAIGAARALNATQH